MPGVTLKSSASSDISANRSLLTSGGTYKFAGCTSLSTLHLYNTSLGAVNFPISFSNAALDYLDLRY